MEGLEELARVEEGRVGLAKGDLCQQEGFGPMARLGTGSTAVHLAASVTEGAGSLAVRWIEHPTGPRPAVSLAARPEEEEKPACLAVATRAKAGLPAGLSGSGWAVRSSGEMAQEAQGSVVAG